MAKTKRKQLAALAALKATSPETSGKPTEEHQDVNGPTSNEEPNDKSSGSLEIRQQRIIFWIPPLDPSPRLVNSRSFRISGTPSRKRKLSSVNEEEKTSSDTEDGNAYRNYAKIVLKLDNWSSKKNVDAPPPVDVSALDAPPVYAEKAYQRRKTAPRILCKEKVLSVLTDNLPASSSVPASKKTRAVDRDQHSLPAGDGETANDLAAGDTTAREPSYQFSRRLGLRTRKTVSQRDLISAKSGKQELRPEQGDTTTSRNPEKTQEIASFISRQQKIKPLKDTLAQHRLTSSTLDVTSHAEDQRNLRSSQKLRNDPGLSAAGLKAQVSNGIELKKKLKLSTSNTAVLRSPNTATQPTDDGLESASHSDSPSYRKRAMSVDRPFSKRNNLSPLVSKVNLRKRASEKQGRVMSMHIPVARIRKRALTQTLGRRISTPLETVSVQESAELDDYRPDTAVPTVLIDPVWNRISTGARVPTVDEPNELQHGSDVVTSSNNAALNSRSRRISFLGRHAGTSEEELKRVNLGSNVRRGSSTSLVNSDIASGRANANGNNQLRAKSGGAAASFHHENGDNARMDSNQSRVKPGGAATPLHLRNGDNGHFGTNQLREKAGGAATSFPHQNGDNGRIALIRQGGKQVKPQSLLHGSRIRNQDDLATMVRSKLDEVGGLTEWLIGGGLGVFVDLFQERKIKEGDLLQLTMSSLKETGVQAVGPRRKLIWMIEHLL